MLRWVRYLIVFSFVYILLSAVTVARPVYAQEQPQGPIYIVQSGDNLTSIALRFGVTVNDLMAANNITNPNALALGARLVIPGLEGVSGVLETRSVAFGDSLIGLSRWYQVDPVQLTRLNRLVSPRELAIGTPLVLPVKENLPPAPVRFTLGPGETLLEKAAALGENPYKLADANYLPTVINALPGDVLVGTLVGSSGPVSIPWPVTEVLVSQFSQGRTGTLKVQTEIPIQLSGSLGKYSLAFFELEQGVYAALQGINALATPEMVTLTLQGEAEDGTRFVVSQMLYVRARDYIFERINVPPEYIDPETTQAEEALLRQMVSQATPYKYWQGVFSVPSPYPDCINSTFGNRRSYNGSAFTFYHGGVDYCGGVGVQIFAPAAGKVVFAGEVDIRGQFTLVDHGWGVYSGYVHQSEILVSVGEEVQPGQVIGLVGSTGRSTGPHLHWEIWVNGELVEPLDWLRDEYP